ncbi:MAG: VWA domain-containing protein, partial [Mesorhizobium sp.]
PPDPAKPDTLFVPYFAPDDPQVAQRPSASYGNSDKYYNNSYLDDGYDKTKLGKQKDNFLGIDLSDLVGDLVTPGRSAKEQVAKYVAPVNEIIAEAGTRITVGPNRACPTPVVPLTDDFDKLRKAASEMTEWNGSGTNVSEGLSWGMRVLSPSAPYTDGAPWKTPGISKIVLLLTDGENVVYGASEQQTKSDYTSYGYLAGGRFGSDNQATAARNVDGWTKSVCTQLKDQGVQIYTMVLQSDTAANRALYSACASDPSGYYAVNDPTKLPDVFQQIANKFSKLQLTN